MTHRWKKALDKGKLAGAILTDLSKAFDCLNHELLIAKLEAYGFGKSALRYIYDYLSGRKQRSKINDTFSEWCNILFGVPQGSILGPLLFNIYMNDIFFFLENCDLANFADDSTPYTFQNTESDLLENLEVNVGTLVEWFHNNFLKLNENKCHLILSSEDSDISLNIGSETIFNENSVKLLGITFDSKLKFNEHIKKLCKKASQKLHALARISKFMSSEKLRIVMKAFIESEFSYCPLIWMFHDRTLNARINKIHERALRLVYKDYDLSFDQLLQLDNSFSIHHRNLQKLAIEMYKVQNNLTPNFMKEIFNERNLTYDLRNANPFLSHNIRTVKNGTDTISFQGPKLWVSIPSEIKESKTLPEFQSKIKRWKPINCSCRICKTWISDLGFL